MAIINSQLVLIANQRYIDVKAYAASKGYTVSQAVYEMIDTYLLALKESENKTESVSSPLSTKVL